MTPMPDRARLFFRFRPVLMGAALALSFALALGAAWSHNGAARDFATRTDTADHPDLGPNVYVFSPGLSETRIQATVSSIATRQSGNQFGAGRYALLFEPGTYGSASDPLFL